MADRSLDERLAAVAEAARRSQPLAGWEVEALVGFAPPEDLAGFDWHGYQFSPMLTPQSEAFWWVTSSG